MDEKQKQMDLLVEQAQQGDQTAFGLIYDQLIDPIYRYVYFKTPSVEVAEDLTEDVFFKAWKNLKKYKSQGVPFSSWVFRIAHNEVVNFYRQNKEVLELDETWQDYKTENSPENLMERQFIQKEIQIALRDLPEQQAQAVILKYINDLSNQEISETMNKSETAVRILLSRGLAKLQSILKHKGLEKLVP